MKSTHFLADTYVYYNLFLFWESNRVIYQLFYPLNLRTFSKRRYIEIGRVLFYESQSVFFWSGTQYGLMRLPGALFTNMV